MSSVQFVIASGECPNSGEGVFSPCDDSAAGGLCANSADGSKVWCCPPNDKLCGRWGQTCSGPGALAGSGQVYCQLGNDSWCCDSEDEVCIPASGAINLCRTKFKNPYANVTKEEALSRKANFFASTSATQSASPSSSVSAPQTTTSTLPVFTNAATSSSTPSPLPPATSTSPTSTATIVGIVFGATALLLFAVACVFFLRRKRAKMHKDRIGASGSEPPSPPLPQASGMDSGITFKANNYTSYVEHQSLSERPHNRPTNVTMPHGRVELQGQARSELQGQRDSRSELP